MAFALVANTHGVNDSSVGAVAPNVGTINTTGADLIVISVAWYDGLDANTVVSDSKSNTWTGLTRQSTGGHLHNRLYYCLNPIVGSGHYFQADNALRFPSMQVTAWSGANTGGSFDQENGATATNTNVINTGVATPSESNELVIAGLQFETNTAGSVSIGGGFTITDTDAFGSGVNEGGSQAYLIQISSTGANPQWNITNNATDLTATIATFRSAGGGVVVLMGQAVL